MPQTRRDTTHITTLHTFCNLCHLSSALAPSQSLPLPANRAQTHVAGGANQCELLHATTACNCGPSASICPFLICIHCKIEVQSFPKFKSDKSLEGG